MHLTMTIGLLYGRYVLEPTPGHKNFSHELDRAESSGLRQIRREQWKLVLTGFAMSDRNNTLSRQIARAFLTKYIKQNQDLITKFDTPLSPNTVESMVFSIVQTERNILQLTWTSVT
nr:uncharacterized protein LOC117692228 isoform X1 [Crassostrea gigas]